MKLYNMSVHITETSLLYGMDISIYCCKTFNIIKVKSRICNKNISEISYLGAKCNIRDHIAYVIQQTLDVLFRIQFVPLTYHAYA